MREEQVMEAMHRMAAIVDAQNAGDAGYKALAPAFDGPEWRCALALVFDGRATPNGYTEGALTKWRRERKAIEERSGAAAAEAA